MSTTTIRNVAVPMVAALLLGLWQTGCTKKFVPPDDEGCGNGVIEAAEECDDDNTDPGDGCGADCVVESGWRCQGQPSVCVRLCGNGAIDAGESCDGTDLNGNTCTGLGLDNGALACLADCSDFDTSGCTGDCGDGRINNNETCDGSDLNQMTCQDFNMAYGQLACLGDCSDFDLSTCYQVPLILINEVGFGNPDELELMNNSTDPVNLQGFVMHWYAFQGGNPVDATWVLPAYDLQPGDRVVLEDDPSASGATPDVSPGLITFHENIPWGDVAGAAALYTAASEPVDFVQWCGPDFPPPTGFTWTDAGFNLPCLDQEALTISRLPEGTDTDSASDFCVTSETLGSANAVCYALTPPGTLLITEIDVANPDDRVELYNPGSSGVDLNNWILAWEDDTSGNAYALPNYTLAAGAYITIIDDSSGASYVDATGIHVRSIGWTFNEIGACWLLEPEMEAGVDFVRWGGHTALAGPLDTWSDNPAPAPQVPNGSRTLGRETLIDNNQAGDWCLQIPSPGSANGACQ